MSWQTYVDTSLMGSGQVDKGAIVSIAGDSVWAASAGFDLSAEDMKAIASIAKDDKDAITKLFSDGLHLVKERFVLLSAADGTGYARAANDESNPDKQKEGIVICASKQAIVVAHHNHEHTRQNVTPVAQSLADYLIKSGY